MILKRLANVIAVLLCIVLILGFVISSLVINSRVQTQQTQTVSEVDSGTGAMIAQDEELTDWDVYVNYDYRYIFHYPGDVEVTNIKLADHITDQEKYNGIHSDDICVKLQIGEAWADIYVNPKDPSVSKFCGKYEYEAEQNIKRSEIIIDRKSFNLQTISEKDKELNFMTIENGDVDLKIEYGGKLSGQYVADKEVIEKIIKSIKLL